MLNGPLVGLLFSRKLLTYTQAWSFSANYSQEPGTPTEAHSPSSPSVSPVDT